MLPQDFIDRMEQMLGEEFSDFLAGYDGPRYQALRINPLKTDTESFFSKSPFGLCKVPWAEYGYYYGTYDTPGKHPWHEAGVYYIQEPSAMAPAEYLLAGIQSAAAPAEYLLAGIQSAAAPAEYLMADAETERVLDLCAAPGGKSTQIAAAMRGKGILICNEIHPARAKILSENVERMGITNAMVTNETPQRLADTFSEYFTRILVDAPCSGEGMFRKNEEAKEEWSLANVKLCAARQDEILDCAASMLAPGGRLVYSTCTFAPEENEGSIFRFLQRHPEFSAETIPLAEGMSRGVPEWAEFAAHKIMGEENSGVFKAAEEKEAVKKTLSHTIRLWPHRLHGEGHYLAVLRKSGELRREICGYCKNGTEQGISPKEFRAPGKGILEFEAFLNNILKNKTSDFGDGKKTVVLPVGAEPLEGRFLKFGDQLYFVPEGMPSAKGLKVLRPGLHLGTIKKNRFEPSHALALAVSPDAVCHVADLPSDKIRSYINGETFPWEGEKGWYLVTVDGYGIGWGKLAGGIMKNHYPKGLRKNLG